MASKTIVRKHSGRVLSFIRPDNGVREHYLVLGGKYYYAGSDDLCKNYPNGNSSWDKSGFFRRSISTYISEGIDLPEAHIKKWSGIKGNLLSKTYIRQWTSLQGLIDVGF